MSSCLVIIDVQKGLINEASKHIPGIVQDLQNQYDSVFVFRYVNPPHSPYRTLLSWNKFSQGSEETELAFTPRSGAEVVVKGLYSCMNDAFLRRLKELGVSEVHLCGLDTNACVLKTAVDLFELGLRPVVLSSACASHSGKDLHDAALTILERLIGPRQIV